MPTGFRLPSTWPRPADPDAASRLRERFAAIGRAEARLAAREAGAALLDALGGNSPYLADLAVRESATVRQFAANGPDAERDAALAMIEEVPPDAPRATLAATLRAAKRRIALLTALADIGGVWDLGQVTATLTALAETALRKATAHLLLGAAEAGAIRLPDPAAPERGSGFTVLGMGKLGARELNYSSDIDLILLYDPAPHAQQDGLGSCFTRIARGLVALMEQRDADGYVFRTDLRLRPDPAATPPAIAIAAALTYYESLGQNWERAAMLKARPVAGDLALGAGFLDAIRPFIWRRRLDFAAVADIHAMKRRIDEHKRARAAAPGADPVARIAGHNLKLGRGGIREIEFLVQTLQLVWGGKDPELRTRATREALRLLTAAGHMSAAGAAELDAAYLFLRGAEHRLQMVADRQTHALPERPEQIAAFATFLGHDDAASFAAALLGHLDRVTARYAELFQTVPEAPAQSGSLDFRGDAAPPETLAALRRLGFQNPDTIVAAVRSWLAGRVRAMRSERARELMQETLPALLAALARQAQPDAAFARFETFLGRLPAGVQLLALFHHNPALLDRVAGVLGAAPSLADHLATVPSAVEGLLVPDAEPAPRALLRIGLADAAGLEEAIRDIGRVVREQDFRLSVAVMDGRMTADAAGLARASLADGALAALLPRVLSDQARRFGRVPGGGMAIVALGKLGSREMMTGSDLDLMLIYDHPPGAAESAGGPGIRCLPASQWFLRAAHAVIAALTSPGAEGPLYAVDMRLRPSGNKGPVAVSLASFVHYHAGSAWTWERMALTRARVVAGPPELRRQAAAAIRTAIAGAAPPDQLRRDAAAMRARIARDLPPSGPWDVKLRPGGLIEVEFIAQVLQLMHARDHPGLADPTTRVALQRLARAGLLGRGDAALLIGADRLYRTVQGMLRITLGRRVVEPLPPASAAALIHVAGAKDVAGLATTLDRVAADVRAAFDRLIGPPDPALLTQPGGGLAP